MQATLDNPSIWEPKFSKGEEQEAEWNDATRGHLEIPHRHHISHRSEQYDDALIRTALEEIEDSLVRIGRAYRFRQLADTWKRDTRFMSNVTARMLRPEYQKIIGMGEPAIPFILRDLKDNGPNDWFWALTAITDVNPITEDMAGNMTVMTEAWLRWGKKAGYLKS